MIILYDVLLLFYSQQQNFNRHRSCPTMNETNQELKGFKRHVQRESLYETHHTLDKRDVYCAREYTHTHSVYFS